LLYCYCRRILLSFFRFFSINNVCIRISFFFFSSFSISVDFIRSSFCLSTEISLLLLVYCDFSRSFLLSSVCFFFFVRTINKLLSRESEGCVNIQRREENKLKDNNSNEFQVFILTQLNLIENEKMNVIDSRQEFKYQFIPAISLVSQIKCFLCLFHSNLTLR